MTRDAAGAAGAAAEVSSRPPSRSEHFCCLLLVYPRGAVRGWTLLVRCDKGCAQQVVGVYSTAMAASERQSKQEMEHNPVRIHDALCVPHFATCKSWKSAYDAWMPLTFHWTTTAGPSLFACKRADPKIVLLVLGLGRPDCLRQGSQTHCVRKKAKEVLEPFPPFARMCVSQRPARPVFTTLNAQRLKQ